MNLGEKFDKQLPLEIKRLLNKVTAYVNKKQQDIYLVGGMVRDIILGSTSFDIDLTVNGDAIALAKKLSEDTGGKLKIHPMFNTATIVLGDWNIDLAMLRSEIYTRPGALPLIKPGTLATDLRRRDFTINAMAMRLNKDVYGELVDPYDGVNDLKEKTIKVLHPQSFTDDATRIWRAIRYEQRLDFTIAPDTLTLIKKDLPMLATVGGFRLRGELELVLEEKTPEKILRRAYELGVLTKIHPSLRVDGWIKIMFEGYRNNNPIGKLNPNLYLGLLVYRLKPDELKQVSNYLKFSTTQIESITQCRAQKFSLDISSVSPSDFTLWAGRT